MCARQVQEAFFSDRQHAASSAGAVINKVSTGFNLISDRPEDEIGHQLYYVPRGELLASLFIVLLIEAADQFLKYGSHPVVIQRGKPNITVGIKDGFVAQVDRRVKKLFDQAPEDVGLDKRGDLVAELEFCQDLLDVRRKAIEIGFKVCFELLLFGTCFEVPQGEIGRVIERLAGSLTKGVALRSNPCPVEVRFHLEHGILCGHKKGVQTADNRHR